MNTPFTTEGDYGHATLIVEDLTELTLSDLSRACRAQTTTIIELVEEGVITPQGAEPEQWRFTGAHLHRARVAVTLQRDLGVNWAGAALALELLEAMAELKSQLRRQL